MGCTTPLASCSESCFCRAHFRVKLEKLKRNSRNLASSMWKRNHKGTNKQWLYYNNWHWPTKIITLQGKSCERTSFIVSPYIFRYVFIWHFKTVESRVPTLWWTELLSSSIVLWRSAVLILSLNIDQTSIFIDLGGKLEKLKPNRRFVCAMYIALCTRTIIWMLCNFRLEFGTCVECEPSSNVPTFQTSMHEARTV